MRNLSGRPRCSSTFGRYRKLQPSERERKAGSQCGRRNGCPPRRLDSSLTARSTQLRQLHSSWKSGGRLHSTIGWSLQAKRRNYVEALLLLSAWCLPSLVRWIALLSLGYLKRCLLMELGVNTVLTRARVQWMTYREHEADTETRNIAKKLIFKQVDHDLTIGGSQAQQRFKVVDGMGRECFYVKHWAEGALIYQIKTLLLEKRLSADHAGVTMAKRAAAATKGVTQRSTLQGPAGRRNGTPAADSPPPATQKKKAINVPHPQLAGPKRSRASSAGTNAGKPSPRGAALPQRRLPASDGSDDVIGMAGPEAPSSTRTRTRPDDVAVTDVKKPTPYVERSLVKLFTRLKPNEVARGVIEVDRAAYLIIGGKLRSLANDRFPSIETQVEVSTYAAKKEGECTIDVHSIKKATSPDWSEPNAVQASLFPFTGTDGKASVLFERVRQLDELTTEEKTSGSTPLLRKTVEAKRFRYRSSTSSFTYKMEQVKEGATFEKVASAAEKFFVSVETDCPETACEHPDYTGFSFKSKVADILAMSGKGGPLKVEDVVA